MDNILESVKLELDILDSTQDNKLNRYIRKSCVKIINYLNNKKFNTDMIIEYYPEAVIELTCNIYNASHDEHTSVKSIKEGDVSITYTDNKDIVLNQDVIDLLPVPYVSMW